MALEQGVKEVTFEGETNALSVSVAPGDVLHVKLAALPSAGFNWRLLSADPSVISLKETRFEKSEAGADRPPKIGVPANQLFVFEAQAEGETKAVFVYARPWEKDKPPARTAILTVRVGS